MTSASPSSPSPLAGRVVIVTGGGTGIGRALAGAFYEAGARVVIASRDPDNLKKAANVIAARGARMAAESGPAGGAAAPGAAGGGSAAGGAAADRLLPVRLDVRVKESAASVAAHVAGLWGGIDILVNNAGVSGQTPVDGAGPEVDQRWTDIVATSLDGAWHMTRACLPSMPKGGRIINVSSVLGKFGVAGYGAYCAAKHGMIGLTRALAAELAPRGITVNAICPGWVDTSMAEKGVAESAARLGTTPQEFRAAANARVPLGRFLRPEELAPLVLYLASPAAEAMTGQAINLEGGATTW